MKPVDFDTFTRRLFALRAPKAAWYAKISASTMVLAYQNIVAALGFSCLCKWFVYRFWKRGGLGIVVGVPLRFVNYNYVFWAGKGLPPWVVPGSNTGGETAACILPLPYVHMHVKILLHFDVYVCIHAYGSHYIYMYIVCIYIYIRMYKCGISGFPIGCSSHHGF